ncbi:MAG: hypothetical protein K2M17_00160 [Bacilli bacterium]|nr:hypothetical protein [Bacilli bacterium]
MKKIYIIGIIAIIITTITLILVIGNKEKQVISANDDFVYIGTFEESIFDKENYVFTDYTDLKSKFDSSNLTANDFKKNNYVLVAMKYNTCSEDEVTPTDYTINGNKIDIIVKYKAECGFCAPEYMYYLLKVDKNITQADVNIEYKMINNPKCDLYVSEKPIIYLYPENTTDVIVKLENEEYLTTTYPKYNNSWEVTANSDGTLIDKKTGRELYGLYWEGTNHKSEVKKDGFVVKGEDTIEFLEKKLNILGLTDKEANEFIIYWLPKLEKNKYNYIRFETMEEINSYMPLDITPTPDNVIRILMDYKPLDKKIAVEEQNLVSPKRSGFTVVEWGGSLID